MNYKDLMPDDWINTETDGYVRITFVTPTSVAYLGGVCAIEQVSPIPITKEILVKNGFQKLNDKTFLFKDQIEIEVGPKFSEVSARYEDYDRDFDSYNNRYIEIAIIHYIHQLQHLLRLCGIEKELIID